jgi:serine/threonine protein kinase
MANSPQKIGRYEIQAELGRGAMGIVYRALDPNIGRTVALKTMRLDVHGTDEEEILRRFKHEAKLAGVINHPNVVTIYDAGEDQSIFYIAMEYVEGVTLQTLLHQQRVIPAQLMLEISRQILPALDFAHKRGVIHRDIKPANIMLTAQGGAKIMDFGIAKADGGMTSAGQVLGTPAYMSPEQVRGKTLDGRSDLFSFGVCLYEMVTGNKPFAGQNVTTIIYKIMNEQPVPPRDMDLNIHHGLSGIIIKALAKDPNERFQTGKELVKQLESYKDFGSDEEKTQVLASMDAETVPMQQAAPVPAVAAAGVSATKKVRQIATLIGNKTIGGKSKSVESIESTVTVQQKAASSSHKILDPRKIAIMLIALVVVVFVSVGMVRGRNKAKQNAAQAEVSAPPARTASPAASQLAAESPAATPASADPAATSPTDTAKSADTTATKAATKKPSPAKPLAKIAASASAVVVPPLSAAPEFGSVHVTSNPVGAKFTIGGKSNPEWVTPFTATNVSPGEQEVVITKDGFSPAKRRVNIAAGKLSSVGPELSAAVAKINIKSTPPGANILLDGNPTGKVTPAVLSVDPGAHKVIVRQLGYQEENTSVTLKDGESYDFAPTLEPTRANGGKNPFRGFRRIFGGGIPAGQGVVQIQTEPQGADIFIQGKKMPRPTPARIPLDPGTYHVIFRLEGYKPVLRDFTIEKGRVEDLNVQLEAK